MRPRGSEGDNLYFVRNEVQPEAPKAAATPQRDMAATRAGEGRTEIEVFGRRGTATFDGRKVDYPAWAARLRDVFCAVARGEPHPANVDRALGLQHLIARIESQLAAKSSS